MREPKGGRVPFLESRGPGCREGPAQSFQQSREGGFKEPQVTVHVVWTFVSTKSFHRSLPQPASPLSPQGWRAGSPDAASAAATGHCPPRHKPGVPLHGACLPCSPEPPGEQAFLLCSCSRGGLSPHRRALHSPHRLLVGLHSARRQRCGRVPAPNPNTLPVSWGNLVMTLERSPGCRNQGDRDA